MKWNRILGLALSLLIASLAGGFFVRAGQAFAAPLNFATSESITLSSPPTTLTIATGSVADALGVDATSVLVMLSNTTGGSFTLLSSSYDLSVATSSGGGTVTISCSGGTESAVLSQGTGITVYTVTPTTSNCASASAPLITNVTSTGVTPDGATIGWTTNIPADSTVSYGTTTSYGATSTDPTLTTTHTISLTGLSAATPYHYEVASADYGTSTTSGDYTFTTASTNAPTVSVTAPANGATVRGTSVTLSATATPSAGNTIASVQFLVDGAAVGSPVTSAPYQYSWDSTAVSDGGHTVTALATDSQGRQSTSAGIPITVQNDAALPTFSPSAGTYNATQDVTISCATPSSTIYYTTNGTAPTTGSTAYTTPVSVSASATLNAICTATGYINSAAASSNYVIQAIQASGGGGGGGSSVSTGGGGSAYDLTINSGAATTATTSATLSLYGTSAYMMEVSNSSDFASSTWIPYVTSLPWTLAPNPGIQTVYVQFQTVNETIVGSAQASIDFVPSGTPVGTGVSSPATSSNASLIAEIAALQAQLAALLKQAGQSAVVSTPAHFIFTRDLSLWSTGNDVRQLQRFLISQDAGPAAARLKAHGATRTFGLLTYNALMEFQRSVGISPAKGYFGAKTRAYVNARE